VQYRSIHACAAFHSPVKLVGYYPPPIRVLNSSCSDRRRLLTRPTTAASRRVSLSQFRNFGSNCLRVGELWLPKHLPRLGSARYYTGRQIIKTLSSCTNWSSVHAATASLPRAPSLQLCSDFRRLLTRPTTAASRTAKIIAVFEVYCGNDCLCLRCT
jgi:hypothetical protein